MRIFLIILLGGIALWVCSLYIYNLRIKNNTRGSEVSIYLTRSGTEFQLFGQPYTFTGVNVYSAATLYGHNAGCGGMIQDLPALFNSLRPNSIVRIWGWQGSMAIHPTTRQIDWAGLDRVVEAASSSGQRLIVSLGSQAGTCDDRLWKDASWYKGGFMNVTNPQGYTPYSYVDYVRQVVTRYKDSPVIAMWELINEPEASQCAPGYTGEACYGHISCPDRQAAADSLRYFFDTVGGMIKQIDGNHLIESGVIGTGQCGADNTYYQYIHNSPYMDVGSYHDYNEPDKPLPGDQWNGLQVRLNQMRTLQKPLIIGESGMLSQDNSSSCMNFTSRRDKLKAKMDTQFASGIAGYIPWAWAENNAGVCNYDIPPNDPTMMLLREYPLKEIIPSPTPIGHLSPTTEPVVTTIPTPIPTSIPTSIPTISLPTSVVVDSISPVVSISFPTSAIVSRNSTIAITANASDNISVSRVLFSVNGSSLCTDTIAPYSCQWKIPAKPNIQYRIQVSAADASGNTSTAVSTVTAR